MKDRKDYLLLCFSLFVFTYCTAQPINRKNIFSRQDTLRGSITPERSWWDVTHYDITVKPDYQRKNLTGNVKMKFGVKVPGRRMQIDLQQPMELKSVLWNEKALHYTRDGNVYYINFPEVLKSGPVQEITMFFEGNPKEAVNPPWDGGWIWKKDKNGNPWMTVACQGLGASVWYPCKDHQSDEPDSAVQRITTPADLVGVGNGRLREKIQEGNLTTWIWSVSNPINNYNIIPYIGKYANFAEVYPGLKGRLDVSYWVMDYNVDTAKRHMRPDVTHLLSAFEKWFGPYPFYEDGFKLVEAPHLGMEHQSAIAYGNQYRKGYAGKDLSASGWGLKWDFIIVHESGHEWFGNNITANDVADMWLHESFTNYSETLFTENLYGKEAGSDYVTGTRKLIENDMPIIGRYNVNKEGSGDMYYKGGNMIHTIRQAMNNDEKFRSVLTGLNKTYYHKTVDGREVERYISLHAGIDFSKVFDQYLRTTQIPVLEYKVNGKGISYRWANCVDGFNLPVKVTIDKERWLKPTGKWQTLKLNRPFSTLSVDRNFYVTSSKVN
jgi:aminopeptidase N